jgi:uncharacterized membrane protein
MAVDENVGIHVRVVLMVMTGRFHGGFVFSDVVAAVRMLTGRMVLMTLLMAKSGRQTDGDANHQDRGGDAAGDAQDRSQIRRFHYDLNKQQNENMTTPE